MCSLPVYKHTVLKIPKTGSKWMKTVAKSMQKELKKRREKATRKREKVHFLLAPARRRGGLNRVHFVLRYPGPGTDV